MNDLPLVEKYRPQKLDDIIGNTNQIIFFKSSLNPEIFPIYSKWRSRWW